jgi:hypothetical protein
MLTSQTSRGFIKGSCHSMQPMKYKRQRGQAVCRSSDVCEWWWWCVFVGWWCMSGRKGASCVAKFLIVGQEDGGWGRGIV